MEQVLQSKN